MCKEKYPEVPFFKDWKEMVASGTVDAVITTVPHYLHTEIAIYCLEHGMNVLVEKPAGVYAKSVREMNECAAAHPEVAFGIMFNQRTNKLYQKVKEIVASGELLPSERLESYMGRRRWRCPCKSGSSSVRLMAVDVWSSKQSICKDHLRSSQRYYR